MRTLGICGRTGIARLCVAAALGMVGTASAQSASAQAEAMFREGRALLAASKVSEACAAFESSQRLEPAASTLMNLAACRERNDQLATAWGLFVDVERATRDAKDSAARTLHQVARDRAKRLEPRMSKLTIAVPAGSHLEELEILRDADRVEPAMWNRALPVDGGRYKITARAPGAVPWSVEVDLGAEGDSGTVEIPRLSKAAASVPAPPLDIPPGAAPGHTGAAVAPRSPAASRTPITTAPRPASALVATADGTGPDHPGSASPRLLPLAFTGGGALLIGGSVGLYLWGKSSYDAARHELTDQAKRDSLYHDANTRRHLAVGLAVAGLACGGAAAWLYFTGRATEGVAPRTTGSRIRVVPIAGGRGGSGLVMLGGF